MEFFLCDPCRIIGKEVISSSQHFLLRIGFEGFSVAVTSILNLTLCSSVGIHWNCLQLQSGSVVEARREQEAVLSKRR
jgi:hypothetical protein